MPQCAVATCRNSHRRTRGRRIRYHRFPQIPEVRARWVRACGRAPLSNGDIPFNIQTARICSLHFANDSYEKDMEHLVLGLPVRSRLRRGAVPTIGVPVNVQPVTKMLVEDAKRSILKVAHGKIFGSTNKIVDGDEHYYRDKHHNQNHQPRHERLIVQDANDRGETNLDDENNDDIYNYDNDERHRNFEQKITGIDVLLALGLKPACRLNKIHAMDCGSTSTTGDNKNMNESKVEDKINETLKIPQNRQNGAALPEETTTATSATTGHIKIENLPSIASSTTTAVKKENESDAEEDIREIKKKAKTNSKEATRKRRSNENTFSTNGNPKRICLEQRERYIDSLVGCERVGAEELAARADELRAEVQALDELARAKEMEWNEILSMRKLKEEAYLRVERKRQVMCYLESNSTMPDNLPPASLSILPEWEESCREHNHKLHDKQESSNASRMNNDERFGNQSQSEMTQGSSRCMTDEDFTQVIIKRDNEMTSRHQKSQRNASLATSSKLCNDNGRKQRRSIDQSIENRQIGEGRQGPIVDVRSIIADYRLRHPEMVPRRGRRMRNSVNIGLGAGGAMVDASHVDSRPSSTDSCKSTNNANDVNNSMSFKDVLVQFAKLSQQQGEPVKTPQNYPDVTLHPVAPSPTMTNSSTTSNQTGSLLHGILTKSQSPRPTTFSPTLARLLTAPERDRNTPASVSVAHQPSQAQHLLQSYQNTNSVTISDLLSSSKARTEITITPVVNSSMQSTPSNNIVHVDDIEEENALTEERDTRRSATARDNREDRDTPPRCQGCHERAAQFVCAGCGNQWYCSRECQVSAWDEHSEVCSG